jgi:hypothetical protein
MHLSPWTECSGPLQTLLGGKVLRAAGSSLIHFKEIAGEGLERETAQVLQLKPRGSTL